MWVFFSFFSSSTHPISCEDVFGALFQEHRKVLKSIWECFQLCFWWPSHIVVLKLLCVSSSTKDKKEEEKKRKKLNLVGVI